MIVVRLNKTKKIDTEMGKVNTSEPIDVRTCFTFKDEYKPGKCGVPSKCLPPKKKHVTSMTFKPAELFCRQTERYSARCFKS